MSSFMDEQIPRRRGVTFGHEESRTLDPVRRLGRDPFLARRPVEIEEDGILGPDTREHPAYAERKQAFEDRARARYQGDDEPSYGALHGEDAEIEAELAAEKKRANEASAQATQAAGFPSYSVDGESRAVFADRVNQREFLYSFQGSFADLSEQFNGSENQESIANTPWREVMNPNPSPITSPEYSTDAGAQRFRMRNFADYFGNQQAPGQRTLPRNTDPAKRFMRATPNKVAYGEGRNAEKHPTSYYPNAAWAAPSPGEAESGTVGAGRSVPVAPTTRSNRVMGQYWRTFKERSAAGAGFFGALFGRGMRRANARVDQAARDRSRAELSAKGAAIEPNFTPTHGLDMEVGNKRRRLWGKASRISEGRGGFNAPDTEENYAMTQEQMGYTLDSKVGSSIPEATLEEEDDDSDE